jgi:peptidoglycan/LPS O-acetylase OafA/YrhL
MSVQVSGEHERYRSLDLLRASAIAMVITAHSVLAYGAPKSLAPLQLGGIGVDLFFVLSGWLLGNQLIREFSRTGSINLTRFWIRRWMRTLPAYYAVLLVTSIQLAITRPEVPLRPEYLVFLQNYTGLPYFFISWSLCVEEHFYLLVGPVILLLARMGSRRWLAIAMLLSAPLLFRQLGWYGVIEETHVRWDGCMLGVALAVCRTVLPSLWKRLSAAAPVLAAVGVLLIACNLAGRWWPALGIRDYELLVYALIFAALVLLATSDSRWRERMYVPGGHYVAVRAYSLYLVHPDVLWAIKRIPLEIPFPLFYLAAWIGSCIVAEGLYRLVEKPFMDARNRIAIAR